MYPTTGYIQDENVKTIKRLAVIDSKASLYFHVSLTFYTLKIDKIAKTVEQYAAIAKEKYNEERQYPRTFSARL